MSSPATIFGLELKMQHNKSLSAFGNAVCTLRRKDQGGCIPLVRDRRPKTAISCSFDCDGFVFLKRVIREKTQTFTLNGVLRPTSAFWG